MATVQWAQSEGQVVVVQMVLKDLPGSLSLESSDLLQLRVAAGLFPIGAGRGGGVEERCFRFFDFLRNEYGLSDGR